MTHGHQPKDTGAPPPPPPTTGSGVKPAPRPATTSELLEEAVLRLEREGNPYNALWYAKKALRDVKCAESGVGPPPPPGFGIHDGSGGLHYTGRQRIRNSLLGAIFEVEILRENGDYEWQRADHSFYLKDRDL